MTNSLEFVESGVFAGRKAEKAPGKSNFSQTCSLLSQYLKEKRALGDLSLGMTCCLDVEGTPRTFRQSATPTLNLFSVMEKSDEVSSHNMSTSRSPKSMDFFPQQAGFGSFTSKVELSKMADSSANKSAVVEPETAQMTIFYGGRVFVYDDFPAAKAKDVMLFASKNFQNPSNNTPNLAQIPVDSSHNLTQDCIQQPSQPDPSVVPLARKASLERFLAKRRGRFAARGPYDTSSTTFAPSKHIESKTWLALAANSSTEQEM